jgi:hypothetical protein
VKSIKNMKHMLSLMCGLTLLLALVGCVAPVEKIAVTPTGRPEVTINAPIDRIKAEIISVALNEGYTIDQDSTYMLRFSRPLGAGENFGAALTVGNAYSANRRVTTYTFSPHGVGVRVVVSSQWQAQMPGGQSKSTELADGGNVFNAHQQALMNIKEKLEAPIIAADGDQR